MSLLPNLLRNLRTDSQNAPLKEVLRCKQTLRGSNVNQSSVSDTYSPSLMVLPLLVCFSLWSVSFPGSKVTKVPLCPNLYLSFYLSTTSTFSSTEEDGSIQGFLLFQQNGAQFPCLCFSHLVMGLTFLSKLERSQFDQLSTHDKS